MNPPAHHARRRASPGVRLRIGGAFALLGLLLFGLITALSGRQAFEASQRAAGAALQQTADRLAERLDADMAARFREVKQLAEMPALFDSTPDAARWRVLAERLQQSMRHYSWIGIARPDGRVLAATGGLLEGRDVSSRPWFDRGLHGTVVNDVHDAVLLASLLPGAGRGEPPRFVDVAAPVVAGGRTQAVLGAHLSWAWAEERRREALGVVDPALGLEIVLTDRAGRIVLGPAEPTLADAAGTAAPGRPTARDIAWSDRQRYLTASSPSRPGQDYPGMGWVVVVRQPLAGAFADAAALQHRLWALGAAGALLFGVVGWWLAGRLTEPLRRLAASTRAVALANDADQDEVGHLAAAVARLVEDLRERERELRTLNERLEGRVRERTASLETANEDLRSFSRSVSHDLRGPLGAMSMALRQLLDGRRPVPETQARRRLDLVMRECDRLHQLTDDLLTLATVEQRPIETASVDHGQLVQAVLDELRAASGALLPALDVQALPPSSGDAALLRQVWANLLSNAVKFSSKAPAPRVVVRGRLDGAQAVYTVEDNGVGFDEAQSGRLFEAFQRLHSASAFTGTGIGLTIVKRVVHRHGGQVSARVRPEGGARFEFTIPLDTTPLARPSPAAVASP